MTNSLYFNRSIINNIKYPIITDKATRLLENNQYSIRKLVKVFKKA